MRLLAVWLLAFSGDVSWAQKSSTEAFHDVLNQWSKPNPTLGPLYCSKNPEPQVCTDPVKAICEGSMPEPKLKSRSEVIKSLMARMPKDMQDPNFIEKNSQALLRIQRDFETLFEVSKYKRGGDSKEKSLSPGFEAEINALEAKQKELLRERQKYAVALDGAITAEFQKNGIDLGRDLFEPLKKSLIETVYAKNVFHREVLPTPTSSPSMKALENNLKNISHGRDHTLVVLNYAKIKVPPLMPEETIGAYDLSKVINKIRFLNGQFAKEAAKPNASEHLLACPDIRDENASFTPAYRDPTLVICPGLLIDILRGRDLQGLAFVMGHELGHSISSTENYITINADPEERALHELEKIFPGSAQRRKTGRIAELAGESQPSVQELERRTKLNERYSGYLSCMRNRYYPEISTNGQIVDYLIHYVLPETERLIKHVRSDSDLSPADRKARLARLTRTRTMLKSIEKRQQSCQAGLRGHQPASQSHYGAQRGHFGLPDCPLPSKPFDGFDDEVIADALAADGLILSLRSRKPQERLLLARAAFGMLCDPRESFDLTHPPARARINPFFSRPEVRQLFGCSSKPKVNACDLRK